MTDKPLRYTIEIGDKKFELQNLGDIEEVFGTQQVFTPEVVLNSMGPQPDARDSSNSGVLTKYVPTGKLKSIAILDGKASRSPLTLSLAATSIEDPTILAFFVDYKKSRQKFDAKILCTISYSIEVIVKLERCFVAGLSFGTSSDPTLVVELVYENLETDDLKIGTANAMGPFKNEHSDVQKSLEFGSGTIDGVPYIEIRPYYLTKPITITGGHGAEIGASGSAGVTNPSKGSHDLEQLKDPFPPPYRGIAIEFLVCDPFSSTVDQGAMYGNDILSFLQKFFMGITYFALRHYPKGAEGSAPRLLNSGASISNTPANFVSLGSNPKAKLPENIEPFNLPITLTSGVKYESEQVLFIEHRQHWAVSTVDQGNLYPLIIQYKSGIPGINKFFMLQDFSLRSESSSKLGLTSIVARLNLIAIPDFFQLS